MSSFRSFIWAHLACGTVLMVLGLVLLALRNHEAGMPLGLIALSMFMSVYASQKLLERIEKLEQRETESADVSEDKEDVP